MLHAVRLTGVQSVTWPSVILDLFSVLLLAVALYSQTATVIAIDRYWNHNYKRTGDVRRLLARIPLLLLLLTTKHLQSNQSQLSTTAKTINNDKR